MIKVITFVLPGASPQPTGGSRIVYEYANRLARKGYHVHVVHAPITRVDPSLSMIAKAVIRYPQRLLDKSYRPDGWFTADSRVDLHWVPTLHDRYIPDGDAVIATAWKTAEWVAGYSAAKGRKYYFIQHFEDWDGPSERVEETWRLPLHKIVIAKWLEEKAKDLGERTFHVPNALDFECFYRETPMRERRQSHVAMLYHTHAWKGCADGLAALREVKKRVPQLTVEIFGVVPPPPDFPAWIEYHQNPPQSQLRALFNRASIYVAPSWAEGWALPPAEAMACGAALASTNIGGFEDYAIHEGTALLSPPQDPFALAENVIRLIEDDRLRNRLAEAGYNHIRTFRWENSVEAFEQALNAKTPPDGYTVKDVGYRCPE